MASSLLALHRKQLAFCAIGLQGFEPWTSPTRTARSTKLSHSPNKLTFAIILPLGKDGAATLPCSGRGASITTVRRSQSCGRQYFSGEALLPCAGALISIMGRQWLLAKR